MSPSYLTTHCELAPAEVNLFFLHCALHLESQSFYLIILSSEKKEYRYFPGDQDLLGCVRVILASLE